MDLKLFIGVECVWESLALTPADFDFQACTIRINKSYQRFEGKDTITDPKTVKSNRIITRAGIFKRRIRIVYRNAVWFK